MKFGLLFNRGWVKITLKSSAINEKRVYQYFFAVSYLMNSFSAVWPSNEPGSHSSSLPSLVAQLAFWRFLLGVGIGGTMLYSGNRSLCF
jgi:hypothetical protein